MRTIVKHRKIFLKDSYWCWTWRFPWQDHVSIYVPSAFSVAENPNTIRHELFHANEQWAKWWGPWLIPLLYFFFPLPFLFSGRWLVERGPYLDDIRHGLTVDAAVHILWKGYAIPWPRCLMRRWFEKHKGE